MIISYSGETAQMLEIARQCKRSHPALTSFGENSLTCYADCKLTLSTKESIYQNLGDYASHLSMTLLLDHLVFRVLPAELPEELYLQAGTRQSWNSTHLHQSYFVESAQRKCGMKHCSVF